MDLMINFITGRSAAKEIALRTHFNKPDLLMEAEMIDDILRGLAMMPMESMDNTVTDEVTNHLFEQNKPKSGKLCFDLNKKKIREKSTYKYFFCVFLLLYIEFLNLQDWILFP